MLVLIHISKLFLGVFAGDIFHISTVKADSKTENTVAVGCDRQNLLIEPNLLIISKILLSPR